MFIFLLIHVCLLTQCHKLQNLICKQKICAHFQSYYWCSHGPFVESEYTAILCVWYFFVYACMLQIESKIHYLSSGSEMSGVGRVLLQHFRTQGTPVMIGRHMCVCVYVSLCVKLKYVHKFEHNLVSKSQYTNGLLGGGVLAHTILGVEFSETDGDIRWRVQLLWVMEVTTAFDPLTCSPSQVPNPRPSLYWHWTSQDGAGAGKASSCIYVI